MFSLKKLFNYIRIEYCVHRDKGMYPYEIGGQDFIDLLIKHKWQYDPKGQVLSRGREHAPTLKGPQGIEIAKPYYGSWQSPQRTNAFRAYHDMIRMYFRQEFDIK